MGVPGGTYFDVLVVTLLAQAVSAFSGYGWYIYLLVSQQSNSVRCSTIQMVG